MKTLKINNDTLYYWFLVNKISWTLRQRPLTGEILLVLSEDTERGWHEYAIEVGALVKGAELYTPCFCIKYERGKFILTPDQEYLGMSYLDKQWDVSKEVWLATYGDELKEFEAEATKLGSKCALKDIAFLRKFDAKMGKRK